MGGHSGSDGALVRFHSLQLQLNEVAIALHIVAQERRGFVQVHDQHVDIAVVVKIAEGAAPAGVGGDDTRTGLVKQFFELAILQASEHNALALEGVVGQHFSTSG